MRDTVARLTLLGLFVGSALGLPSARAEGLRFDGRVEDGRSHVPIGGAKVSILDGMKESTPAVSNAEGVFSIAAAERLVYRAKVRAPGYAEQIVELNPREPTVLLRKGVAVSGTVMSAEGAPVAGATLRCRELVSQESDPVSTDKQGRFSILCPEGPVHLVARASGFGALLVHASHRVQGETLPDQVVKLQRPISIRGKALDAQGAPTSGAEVFAYFANDGTSDVPAAFRVSGPKGEFEFEALSPGEWRFALATEQKRVAYVPRQTLAVDSFIEIRLPPDRALSGTVTRSGKPEPHASLRLTCDVPRTENEDRRQLAALNAWGWRRQELGKGGYDWSTWIATTDEGGRYSFTHRISGPCAVEITDRNGSIRREIHSETSVVDIPLEIDRRPSTASGVVRGRVLGTDGKPFVFDQREYVALTAVAGVGSPDEVLQTWIRPDGTFRFERVPDGAYSLSMYTSRPFATAASVPRVEGGAAVDADMIITRFGSIAGQAVDADTKEPLSKAQFGVTFEHAGSATTLPMKRAEADGRFVIGNAVGTATITIWQDGYKPAIVRKEIPEGAEFELGEIPLSPSSRDGTP